MLKVLGVTLVVLAVALAIVPHYTDCQSQGLELTTANGKAVPMKCHWTGVAEFGMAFPLAAVGAMMIISRRKETLSFLSVTGIILAGVSIALPNGLIGVCATPTHTCATTMKPALTALGGIIAGASILGLILSARSKVLS
ncbi:MAG: hypothetical protein A2Y92_04440 [Chloroflexi bacterium RBG_13_57_8]|nr:MAG: hypothetical protein A2Y92_04440 [Chloroflexi bacterium RBG_13_57_8]